MPHFGRSHPHSDATKYSGYIGIGKLCLCQGLTTRIRNNNLSMGTMPFFYFHALAYDVRAIIGIAWKMGVWRQPLYMISAVGQLSEA